jgi:hypothetical protein
LRGQQFGLQPANEGPATSFVVALRGALNSKEALNSLVGVKRGRICADLACSFYILVDYGAGCLAGTGFTVCQAQFIQSHRPLGSGVELTADPRRAFILPPKADPQAKVRSKPIARPGSAAKHICVIAVSRL